MAKDGDTTGGLGAKPPDSNEFLRFSHKKKTLILVHFFVEKGHAVSAVTIDNAKIFSQLMSKSRGFAKISERRLQSLLVCEIIDRKLGFSTFYHRAKKGRHGTISPALHALMARRSFST